MPRIDELQAKYRALDRTLKMEPESAIDASLLLAFDNEYPESTTEVTIETDEFTAVCPWTALPDQGKLTVRYLPAGQHIELKSFKYYLLSFRDVGIVQEHVANRILNDLAGLVSPKRMTVTLDYNVRGGLHTVVTVSYPGEADQ